MASRQSIMLELGTQAPDFALLDGAGRRHALADCDDAHGLLVAILCNHCPFVLHILDGFVKFASEYARKELAIVAISPNDAEAYPQDAPAEMARLAQERGFTFPYLFDESQSVAKAFRAVCTPEFYLFDRNRRLVYRGQFDDSRPRGHRPVTGSDLRAAADALLARRRISTEQVPSMGCSIKWKPGNEPEWAL